MVVVMTIRVVMSVRSHGTTRLPLDGFSWNLSEKKFQILLTLTLLTWKIWWAANNVSKVQMGFNTAFKGLKYDNNSRYFTWRPVYVFIISHSFLLRMRNVSDKSWTENQNTHFVFSNFFSLKYYCIWNSLEKYGSAIQVTDDNMAHAHCVLNTKGYKPTLRTCNIYCFSTTPMVGRTRLIVTLYVHSVSSLDRSR
jgi:hypothetical protein